MTTRAISPSRTRYQTRQQVQRSLRTLLNYGLLTFFAIFTVFPFVWMLSTTFKSQGAIFSLPPELIPDLLFQDTMFDSYEEVLTRHNFIRYTFNSFFIATMTGIGQILTSSLAGFAFARMQFKGKNALFAILLATTFLPVEVTIIPEFLLGIRVFHPLLEPIGGWLDTYWPLILPSFMVGSFGTFMMREFFLGIPKDLEEAAALDGAGVFRIYWNVFLPLSRPALTTLFLLAFINNWNELLRPVLYISDSDLRTVTLGLTTFQNEYGAQWNLLLSGSVIAILPLIVVYILAQRYIVEGIATTGLKG